MIIASFLGLTVMVVSLFNFGFLKKDSYVEGVVIETGSGQPLSGVLVMVSNRGWGFIDGQLVWDKDFIYQTVTDQTGKFKISFEVGSSAHVKVNQAGYQPYDNWHDANSRITISLTPV